MSARRLIVIGAGPMGLEAALAAIDRGFDVTVLERGSRAGGSLLSWGPTRAFSPLRMNASARVRAVLSRDLPPGDALLTGPELVCFVWEPLSRAKPLAGRIVFDAEVVSVARLRMTRGDFPGHPIRAERPFRVVLRGSGQALEAEHVLDASGVAEARRPLGPGGPAAGEPKLRAEPGVLIEGLGALHAELGALAGRRVLLIGHGHSAAHAIDLLDRLAAAHPGTHITWAVRSANRRPVTEIAADPLPERAAVAARANALAEAPPPHLSVERRAWLERLRTGSGPSGRTGAGLEIELSGGRQARVDRVVALVGQRPDLSFLSELALEISPVTEGAAGLYRALSGITDCLSAPRLRPADLASGEPGFVLIGSKSYGRMPTFLLENGVRQIEAVLDLLGSNR